MRQPSVERIVVEQSIEHRRKWVPIVIREEPIIDYDHRGFFKLEMRMSLRINARVTKQQKSREK